MLCTLVHRSPSSATSMGEDLGFVYHLDCSWFPSQFYDLIEIFRIGGHAPHTNYLFLGRSSHITLRWPELIDVLQATMSTEGCSVWRRYLFSHASSYDGRTVFS